MTTRARFFGFAALVLWVSGLPALAQDNSDAREVVLSLAQGDVRIERSSGDGWEFAVNGLPLTAGTRVYAAEDSRAEIALEDGSSIRLVGPAEVRLNRLSLTPDGAPINRVEIDNGLVYIDALLYAHADFRIQDPRGEPFTIAQPSRLRFKVEGRVATFAVLEGEVNVLNATGNAEVVTGESYSYILGRPDTAVLANEVPPESDDAWD